MENRLDKYTLKKIRQVLNKPYKVFSLSSEELGFIQDKIVMIIIGLFVVSKFFSLVLSIDISVTLLFVLGFFLIIFLLIFVKRSNKKRGEGVIFFLLKDLKEINYNILKIETLKTNKQIKLEFKLGFKNV